MSVHLEWRLQPTNHNTQQLDNAHSLKGWDLFGGCGAPGTPQELDSVCLCVCVRICRQPVLPHAGCIPHIPDGQLKLQEYPGSAHTVETTFSKHTLFNQSLSVCIYLLPLSLQASQASPDTIICDLTAQIQTQMGRAKGEAGVAAQAG